MKKIFLSSLMLLCAVGLFTACSDDNGSNPTLVQPTTFTLNEPEFSGISLAMSNSIPLTWSQPNYGGWPAAVQYQMEMSLTNTWNVSTDEAAADEDQELVADYAKLGTIYTSAKGDVDAYELDKNIVRLSGWTEDDILDIPENMTVYLRCKASTAGAEDVYSNVIAMNVVPYYIELADADIELWYLVGAEIGSAAWDNTAGHVGSGGLVPMYPVYGNEYDAATGQGQLEYVGYFHAGQGFKLVMTPGSWVNQWGIDGGVYVKDNGGSSDITVSEDGYYKISLNTATNELKIEPYTYGGAVYSSIALPGSHQDWAVGDESWQLKGMSTFVENHDWYMEHVTLAAATEFKFAADMAWTVNWGGSTFPYGIGTQDGPNILVDADGTYTIYFNDITGYYNIIAE